MIQPIGFIQLHRELASKPIWLKSTAEQKVILVTLLMMANFKSNQWEWKGEKFEVLPGQFVTSLESITKECGQGVSIQNVRTALTRFEKLDFLTNESTKSGRLITIANWSLYQCVNKDTNKDTNKDLTKTSQRPNKDLTPKEESNKEKKDDKEVYRSFAHLSLSKIDFEKLKENYTNEQIDTILDSIQNYRKNTTYTSLYLTATKWLKKEYPNQIVKKDNKQKVEITEVLYNPFNGGDN